MKSLDQNVNLIIFFLIFRFIMSLDPPKKRYRRDDPKDDEDDWRHEDERHDYQPYVPVKERRKQKLVKLGRITDLKEEANVAGPNNPVDSTTR